MNVLVIGGGIGGLCLAQGLRKAGVPVTVYERDTHPAGRWEGYRIHIDPAGARSLRACLPDDLWRTFLATAGPGGDFGFLTEQLAELVVVEETISHPNGTDPEESHYAVDRRALRRVLLAGLGDTVHFGAEFERYEVDGDVVTAHFADGTTATGDVLVGADGIGSRVRRQYLPHAEPVSAGVVGLANKLLLTEDTLAWLPPRLRHGMNVVSDAGPFSLFTSAYQPAPGARAALAAITDDVPPVDQPYLLSALVAAPDALPPDITDYGPDELASVAEELIADWHPALRRLIAESEHADRGANVFRVSPETEPWEPTRVTVLGDAIHAVPATGGLGGNAALRDARRLTQALAGNGSIFEEIAEYEVDMREHGYAAIREALTVRDQLLAHGALRTFVARSWFRLCSRITPLRRKTFGDADNEVSQPRAWERQAG
jgi:2-polyprenyl-6-methoxyphenol hydroxylase-like FAD-dependent oxidoreductase